MSKRGTPARRVQSPDPAPGIPFLAIEAFRRHPSPFATVEPQGAAGSEPLASDEEGHRAAHVAIEAVRCAPTPTALLALYQRFRAELELPASQRTVVLAWVEVLFRTAPSREQLAEADELLDAVRPLRQSPPFDWAIPYLEALHVLTRDGADPRRAMGRVGAALKTAERSGATLSMRDGLIGFRELLRGRSSTPESPEGPGLVLNRETGCIQIGGATIVLSPREFALLLGTVEAGTITRRKGIDLMTALLPHEGGEPVGIVEADALGDHRKHILGKVEKGAGRDARGRLAKAFRAERRVFIYDRSRLNVRVE